MERTYFAYLLTIAISLAGCSSGVGTNAGSGTGTLLVRATVSFDSDDSSADLEAHVEKAGQNVDTAKVRVSSNRGAVELTSRGGGDYRASQPGFAGDGYAIDVTLTDADGKVTDELHGSVQAPAAVRLTAPDLTRVVDARQLPGAVLVFTWDGPTAEEARLKLKGGFDSGARSPDPLRIEVPATELKEQTEEIDLKRTNDVQLAGGVQGSKLSVEYTLKATLFVMNPF
jgi:hypothetical protein